MISGINDLLSSSGTIQEMLRELQEGRKDVFSQTEIASASLALASDTLSLSQKAMHRSDNMMSRNFVAAERNGTKRIKVY